MPSVKIEEIAPEAQFKVNSVPASTATVSSVPSSASSVTLLPNTPTRSFFTIFNDSTASLFVKFGTGAATNDFTVKLLAGGYFESTIPAYTGIISGIWDSEDGSAYTTELSE